jgi:tRNA (guanosine-2'-O-)-methyltransferase
MRTDSRTERVWSVLRNRQPDLAVVLENIHDPHNVSAILRTCDAVGVPSVELLYSTEEFPELGGKSASSADKWVGKRRYQTIDECYDALRSDGFLICASDLGGNVKSLYDLDLKKKTALVFGNEHRGVSEEAAARADLRFRIPMMGMIESLNVSVACAVALYEAFRQRLQIDGDVRARFPDATLQQMFEEWIRR